MRALLLLAVVISVGVPVALLDAAPVPKEAIRPPLLDCTGPKGADAKTVRASQVAWAKFLVENSHEKKMALDKAGKVLIEMVLVPPGKYYRGSPEGKGNDDEHPQKVITLSKPMWVGKYEVTQWQYIGVTGEKNPSKFAKVGAEVAKYPIDQVHYDDALTFCHVATGGKYQLLTEAQWEYAYRAGTRTEWYNGDEEKSVGEIAQFLGNNGKAPAEVGSKAANAFGLHDMAGNVWEWCLDWLVEGSYAESQDTDPTFLVGRSSRVLRGGSCDDDHSYSRAAYRGGQAPCNRRDFIGFRICMIIE